MGYLEGLLGGYMDRHHEIETQSRVDAHNAMINQGNVYRQLLSSPDPKIKALAATGIVELGNPARKKGGLTGWMGEMETSPSYPRLMDYIRNLPETEQAAALAPTTPTGGAIPATTTAPGGPGSAALPANAVTAPGSPGPTPTVPSPAGTGVPQGPGPAGATTPPVAPPPEAPAPSFEELTPAMIPNAARGYAGAQPPTGPAPAPMPPPPAGLAAGQGAPMPPPPPGLSAGQPVPMPQPQPLAGPPITAPPPTMPPILAATKEGPGATPAAGGPPTTTAQMLASPPPRPPREFTRASVFPSPADLKSESEQAEVTGLVSGWQEMFRLKGDPNWQENGLKAAMAQKMRAGGGAGLSIGPARLAAALELGYTSVQDVLDRGGTTAMQQVNDRAAELAAASAGETTAARAGAMAHAELSTGDREMNMMKLRDDWRQRSTKSMDQISAVSQMKVAYHAAVTRGDLAQGAEAMAVLWQKGIDPGSVVRESEANRPVQFAGLAARVQGAFDRWQQGGAAIPLEELQKYVVLADEMAQAAALLVEDERARIERIAIRMQIDPRDVVPPPLVNRPPQAGAATATPPPTPPPSVAAPAVPAPGGPPLPTTPPQGAAPVVRPPTPQAARPAPGPGDVTLDSKVMVGPDGKLVLAPR